jgi:hypothetical protein
MTLVMDTQSNGPGPLAERIAAKQARIAERFAQLCAEYEDSPAQRQILRLAAGFMDSAEHTRTEWKRTRAANTAAKLLRSIPRKAPKPPRNAREWYRNGAE